MKVSVLHIKVRHAPYGASTRTLVFASPKHGSVRRIACETVDDPDLSAFMRTILFLGPALFRPDKKPDLNRFPNFFSFFPIFFWFFLKYFFYQFIFSSLFYPDFPDFPLIFSILPYFALFSPNFLTRRGGGGIFVRCHFLRIPFFLVLTITLGSYCIFV